MVVLRMSHGKRVSSYGFPELPDIDRRICSKFTCILKSYRWRMRSGTSDGSHTEISSLPAMWQPQPTDCQRLMTAEVVSSPTHQSGLGIRVLANGFGDLCPRLKVRIRTCPLMLIQ